MERGLGGMGETCTFLCQFLRRVEMQGSRNISKEKRNLLTERNGREGEGNVVCPGGRLNQKKELLTDDLVPRRDTPKRKGGEGKAVMIGSFSQTGEPKRGKRFLCNPFREIPVWWNCTLQIW